MKHRKINIEFGNTFYHKISKIKGVNVLYTREKFSQCVNLLLRNLVILFFTLFCVSTLFAGASMEYYTSEVDSTVQRYGLFVPDSYHDTIPHGICFRGHGFGGHASSSFNSYQIAIADTLHWLFVNLEGRGNTFWDGIGDNDFFRVYDTLKKVYTIDTTHIYFEGASMGAIGAYRMGLRYPHIFAAVGGADGWCHYTHWYRHWCALAAYPDSITHVRIPLLKSGSPVSLFVNAQQLPMFIIADSSDGTVWPEQSYMLIDSLKEAGYEFGSYLPQGGHCAGYNQVMLYNYFRDKTSNYQPRNFTYRTYLLHYGRIFWVWIRNLKEWTKPAEIQTSIDTVANSISITAHNITRYTVYLDSNLINMSLPLTITTNGMPTYSGAPQDSLVITAEIDAVSGDIIAWGTNYVLPYNLHKEINLEGPIGDAFVQPFKVIYGTKGTTDETDTNKTEAEFFVNQWNTLMYRYSGALTCVPDTLITPSDISSFNLILYGDEESNYLIDSLINSPGLPFKLPFRITPSYISIGNAVYTGDKYGIYIIYPNPLNPKKYVVIRHGIIEGEHYGDLASLPVCWPDYVIFDKSLSAGATVQPPLKYLPSTWVETGFFDSYWRSTLWAGDVGAVAIMSPPSTVYVDSIYSPQARITNFGSDTVETFNVTCIIDTSGVKGYSDTKAVSNLGGSDTALIIFTDWVVPFARKDYKVIVFTQFLHDTLPENDTLSITIHECNDSPVVSGLPDTSFSEDDSLQIYLDDYVNDSDDPDPVLNWSYSIWGAKDLNQIIVGFKKEARGIKNLGAKGKKRGEKIQLPNPFYQLQVTNPKDGPIYVNIDSVTHIATITTDPDWNGSRNIIFTADDPWGMSDSDTMIVAVKPVNDAPVIDSISPESPCTTTTDSGILFYVYAYDADSDTLAYDWIINGILDTTTSVPVYSYSSPDETIDTVKIIVSDGSLKDSTQWLIVVKVGAEEKPTLLPKVFSLSQNTPNPFTYSTTIMYQLPIECKVVLKVYDVTGSLIKTLINCDKEPGYYTAEWDAKDFPVGIYFVKFSARDYIRTKKLILMR
ncbi:T9SS type A sorting domain-containing protein [candidate division WOR-3 bacterium]|nr:T9SS type A sorting domain-containing protein [candidate division WOR-3 bacterium]